MGFFDNIVKDNEQILRYNIWLRACKWMREKAKEMKFGTFYEHNYTCDITMDDDCIMYCDWIETGLIVDPDNGMKRVPSYDEWREGKVKFYDSFNVYVNDRREVELDESINVGFVDLSCEEMPPFTFNAKNTVCIRSCHIGILNHLSERAYKIYINNMYTFIDKKDPVFKNLKSVCHLYLDDIWAPDIKTFKDLIVNNIYIRNNPLLSSIADMPVITGENKKHNDINLNIYNCNNLETLYMNNKSKDVSIYIKKCDKLRHMEDISDDIISHMTCINIHLDELKRHIKSFNKIKFLNIADYVGRGCDVK